MISDDLLARVQRLADAEGISADAFVTRCVEDAVEWAEQTHAEIDAIDAGNEPVAPQPMTPEESRRQNAEGLRKFLSDQATVHAERDAARAEELASRKRAEEERRKGQEALMRHVGVWKE